MTAEDPVEFNIFGVNQVQVKAEVGMTFAAALKSFLRQDPNVILIGEIRDLETGAIAVKAALTGHLVLATLHTNDAPATITRLLDMGIEPFNVASAVTVVVAQRLLKKICPDCITPVTYDDGYFDRLKMSAADRAVQYYAGSGKDAAGETCKRCNGSGYKGRCGVYEVLAMEPAIQKIIMSGQATSSAIKRAAAATGRFDTLRMDAIQKAKDGKTDLEQVRLETASDDDVGPE